MYLHIVFSVAPNRAHNQGSGPLKTQHLINHINYNNQYFIMGPSPRQGPLLLNSTINPCPTPLHIVFLGKK